MATIRLAGTILFASLLIGAGLTSVTTAKKPETEPPPPPSPPVYYQVYWLGSLGDHHTWAYDVNDSGTVVGRSLLSNDTYHAFVCQAPTSGSAPQVIAITDLNTMAPIPDGVVLLAASCVNNEGRIAGLFADDQECRGAFVYDLATNLTRFLPYDGFNGRIAENVWIEDLNANGVVVGVFDDADGRWGFVWDPDRAVDEDLIIVDVVGGDFISGINNNLDIVGHDDTIFRWTVDPSDWAAGFVAPNLDILAEASGAMGSAVKINDAGVIAGEIRVRANDIYPARYVEGQGWEVLRLGKKEVGWSTALNREGQICGVLMRLDYKRRDTGFVHDPDNGLWSLDELVNADDPWWAAGDFSDDTTPLGMSDAVDGIGYGMIVGYKWLSADIAPASQNSQWGFVLVPATAEP